MTREQRGEVEKFLATKGGVTFDTLRRYGTDPETPPRLRTWMQELSAGMVQVQRLHQDRELRRRSADKSQLSVQAGVLLWKDRVELFETLAATDGLPPPVPEPNTEYCVRVDGVCQELRSALRDAFGPELVGKWRKDGGALTRTSTFRKVTLGLAKGPYGTKDAAKSGSGSAFTVFREADGWWAVMPSSASPSAFRTLIGETRQFGSWSIKSTVNMESPTKGQSQESQR